ncbi:cytochrome P450 [Pseudovirgaria hyperparasitica]|uniref:Cytochrome P450 n=1 Tax=Pseudovirgaria hyperparasitica TaxID=470096 RepID=A0A6A6W802_9PEZI|nr:cytochrome P450 [Pseudovirgaria hyperparasitica]KAF2758982.1 cytochrome P450 [Pseudovirgaria hyperparasitica]
MLWGHLKVMGQVQMSNPPRAAAQTLFYALREKYNLPDVFYLDLWPITVSYMVIINPQVMNQAFGVSKGSQSLPKHFMVKRFMEQVGGYEGNLVSSEGIQWKKWRAAFNPGFSLTQVMSLVPQITEDVVRFRDILLEKAKNKELFRLEHDTTLMVVNIIGKLAMDHDFDCQRKSNKFIDALHNQVQWIKIGVRTRPSEAFDPRRPYMFWKNNRTMDKYIGDILEDRFVQYKSKGKQKKIAIDLALEAYMKEEKGKTMEQTTKLDKQFKAEAIEHIKAFVFAGHDTTSSTICYAFYKTMQNPEIAAKVRAEHDAVLGPDVWDAPNVIAAEPHILNKLDYTLAVIKETLRLYPAANNLREGIEGQNLKDPATGQEYPMFKHMVVWPVNVSMHREERFFGPRANEFLPERWLHPERAEFEMDKEAFFPFSKGPRNCIGQELAMQEMKIIMAVCMRVLDVEMAYDELHKLADDGSGYPGDTKGEQFGDEAYQVQVATAKPREGMPVRIKARV